MSTVRSTIEGIGGRIDESMGLRAEDRVVRLSPVPQSKDIGRRPLRNFGRVDMTQVVPDPDQPRIEFSPDTIAQLAQSIRDKGQLSPIRVRWSDEVGKWVIISGERRWLATKQSGLATIECFFHEGDLTRSEVLEEQLIENLLREDLKPIEEARAFQSLMGLNGWTGRQLSEQLQVPQSRISRALSLLRLPAEVQNQVDLGEIPPATAYEISKLSGDEARREVAQQTVSANLTHADTRRAVRKRRGKSIRGPRRIQLSFPTETGWTVRISGKAGGSYHEIEQSLQEALAEVRHRIANGVQLY
jgi:ParB family chromosome partitioning protein